MCEESGEAVNMFSPFAVVFKAAQTDSLHFQFLKFVHGFLPRSVYTSGKSSSAAGLTGYLHSKLIVVHNAY